MSVSFLKLQDTKFLIDYHLRYISRLMLSTNLLLGVRLRNRYNDKTRGWTIEEFSNVGKGKRLAPSSQRPDGC